MPETKPPHILVVNVDEMGVHEFAIECPGVTDDCRAWQECIEKACTAREEHNEKCRDDCTLHNDSSEDEPVAHGVRHRYVGDAFVGWGTPTNDCWPATVGGVATAAHDIRSDWTPGRYPIAHGVDEYDENLTLKLIEES